MNLLFHLMMLSLLSAGSAEVVKDFEQSCGQFFAKGKSPTRFNGRQYRQICQTLDNVAHFATFYDTYNKIPVYSAYVFKGIMGCTRLDNWSIEPQLDDNNASPNMGLGKNVKNLGHYQALNEDYEGSGYHRGHLAPVKLANSQGCADASFTLTNAAPQNPSFNTGQWRKLEGNIAERLGTECKSYSAYIVTGVVPGTIKMNNRVIVPSHFWTAFCCLDNNMKIKLSEGFIGKNENKPPKKKTVTELETELKELYNVEEFKLFDLSLKRQREESISSLDQKSKKRRVS